MWTTFRFPFYKQTSILDCGPACLKSICLYYGKDISIEFLRNMLNTSRNGTTMLSLSKASEKLGFKTIAIRSPIERLEEIPLPCIAHWKQNHYIIIYRVSKKFVFVSDPAFGKIKYTKHAFLENWSINSNLKEDNSNELKGGILLLLSPTKTLFKGDLLESKIHNFEFIKKYILSEKSSYYLLLLLLFVLITLNIIGPYLSQQLIDNGVLKKNISLIYLLTLGQIFIVVSQTLNEFFRGMLLLKLGTRINVKLLMDFLTKLAKVNILFFESRLISDLLQRINDQTRLQSFITSSVFTIISSIIVLSIFAAILSIFSIKILLIFILGSFLSFIWSILFLKYRKELDYNRFTLTSESQNKLLEMFYGINDVKIHCIEDNKRSEWQFLQNKILELNTKLYKVTQLQSMGNIIISQIKNILILIIAYQAIIDNQITLGTLYAITFIIGQLNNPIDIVIKSISTFQDAKISLDRVTEIYSVNDEDDLGYNINSIPLIDIQITNVSYQYSSEGNNVLDKINLHIPAAKITAITGKSGSGKSTLLKILLKLYKPYEGTIYVGGTKLSEINTKFWRSKCGVILQDSFLFNDSIKNNIILYGKYDKNKFEAALESANLLKFVDDLPLRSETKIGGHGLNISSGEKQRILIARAIYKQPELLIFDEATNNLDAENESEVLAKLFGYFRDKTVIVVAHRLNTIRLADNIVVLDKGNIIEYGTHQELMKNNNLYYNLLLRQGQNVEQ